MERVCTSYWPALCVLAQGVKQVMIGERIYQYDPLNYLVVAIDLPVTVRIVGASPEQPLLGLTIDLNRAHIGELLLICRMRGTASARLLRLP